MIFMYISCNLPNLGKKIRGVSMSEVIEQCVLDHEFFSVNGGVFLIPERYRRPVPLSRGLLYCDPYLFSEFLRPLPRSQREVYEAIYVKWRDLIRVMCERIARIRMLFFIDPRLRGQKEHISSIALSIKGKHKYWTGALMQPSCVLVENKKVVVTGRGVVMWASRTA
jgi:hypothetical protein